jgi:hypothetical protein
MPSKATAKMNNLKALATSDSCKIASLAEKAFLAMTIFLSFFWGNHDEQAI